MNDTANARERASAAAPSAERVLVVEDDPATRVGLTELVRTWGYAADSARDGEEALEKVTAFRPGIVVTDLVMPRLDGHGLLKALRERDPDVSVIMLTAQGSVESAVDAIKGGAYDYLTKPVDPQRLQILLAKAVERQETMREVKALRRQLRDHGAFGRMIGNSPSMRAIYRDHRAGGADVGVGPRQRRIRHRQGTRRPDHPPAQPARAHRRSSRSTAQPFRRPCSRARSSATRKGRSPARSSGARAVSSWPIAAPSSWTRSPR